MSAETIKEFLVGLGFKVDEVGLQKFNAGIGGATIAITAFGVAAIATAGVIANSVQNIAEHFDKFGKLASQFRTNAAAIDEFADAAGIMGIKEETAVEGLKNLDRAIVDTSMNMGRAKQVFENLGISVKDAAGNLKPTTEVMAELGEKFKGMERGKQIRVMERLGLDPSMLKLFSANMTALRADMAEIDKAAGLDFDKAMAESKAFMEIWREMQREIEKWKLLLSTALESIAVKLMPNFRAQMDSITSSMVEFRRVVMDNLPKAIDAIVPLIDAIMRIAEAFLSIAKRVASAAGDILGFLLDVNKATDGWAGYILAAIVAWKALNLAFLATPLGMITALAAAVALLVDDFLTWKEGGKALIDWGSGFGIVLQGITAALTGLLAYLALSKAAIIAMEVATVAWGAATTIVNGILAASKVAMVAFNLVMSANPIALVVIAVAALAAAAIMLIAEWDTVELWFTSFVAWMKGVWTAVTSAISNAFSAAAKSVMKVFQGVKDWFLEFFEWISAKFAKIAEWGDKIAGFFGSDDKVAKTTAPVKGATPALVPTPQARAAVTGGGQNVNQQTQIVVQGSGDPAATARAVSGQQNRVNADMARNMRGATR